MQQFHLPHVILPAEFVFLLKTNLSTSTSTPQIFEVLRRNPGIYLILERAFSEFDDGRGLEKTMVALGWENFRERVASLYIFKAIHGHYPVQTSMGLVEDIQKLEQTFQGANLHGYSRLFLLGFYFRMANIQLQKRGLNVPELKVPDQTAHLLTIAQGKSEKPDWLVLIIVHLIIGLGEGATLDALSEGKKFEELYTLLPPSVRRMMFDNFLAYGASIHEPELFLYEKI